MTEQHTEPQQWQQVCILCASAPKPHETVIDFGHCCQACADKLNRMLGQLVQLAADAYLQLHPGSTGQAGSHAYGSKPPLNIDAIDPELAPIELNRGDASSAVPILEMLEMWERAIREDRHLAPYGHASAMRCRIHGYGHNNTAATMTGVVSFLQAHMDWIVTEPTFALEEFADHIRRAHIALKRWDPTRMPGGTRILCPTVTEHGDCAYPLYVRGTDDIACRRCGRLWPVDRLILVAGQDIDAWVDAEALAQLAGVHERTIRKWHAAGKVARRGQLYRLQDVRAIAEQLGA